tara:strand:- start:2764 stop:3267 length:504 start_codon:yes stop_codon:yes gene_type:complete
MILTKKEVLKEIKLGRIKITPFSKKNLTGASYDLTLDNKFREFKCEKIIDIKERTNYKKHTKLITEKSLVLNPGEFILGVTKEKIKLPKDICGFLSGRSRFARLGLAVHVTANFVQPNINNVQVLEIKNLSEMPIKLYAGVKVCQIIFSRTEGQAKYKGMFGKQKSV